MTSIYLAVPGHAPMRVDRWFRRLQLVSAAAYSLMHGANDAQKTMGIITGALVTGGYLTTFEVPWRVEVGVLHRDRPGHAVRRLAHHQDDGHEDHEAAAGGWICRGDRRGGGDLHRDADGRRHQHDPHDHRRHRRRRRDRGGLSAVRWGVAGQIVWAWILTIPASAAIGAMMYHLIALTRRLLS